MSLLQGVLRTQTLESLDKQLGAHSESNNGRTHPNGDRDEDDDELVNVVSLPGTPVQSRPTSRPGSRPQSPTRRGARPSPLQPMTAQKTVSRDPLRALPTDVSQRIFSQLSIRDLSRCSRVSKKWNKSQTLNYVWFQHYRKENFHDESLPPGKWTKRESKQNWRTVFLGSVPTRDPPSLSRSGYESPRSGQQTPREMREEKWKQDAEATAKPNKVEMREMYKELGGRKARGKGKLGGTGGMRDRGGWGEGDEF
ncbi:uncharacterized protein TRAVEDRAFT_160063 [Trametes versicolor FP-101664 SS1]|uniref:uncharacterized protein n=1 Tax=Trametes versicolor (strain FP-101664) TaxID=717944 RepID=UPI0004621CB1|nr:uncharacterized protein TRAVEDRAFT_160063 [Trametes versicolor FP-101664 SS1]EIW65205.1 hypothetical protein TRAVEDRAFT_160063 [Trametes versicolor FP-101664 SS1]